MCLVPVVRTTRAKGATRRSGRHLHKQTNKMERKVEEPKFISRRQTAGRWNVSIEWCKRRERSGLLKPVKIGSHVRYKLDDLLAIEAAATIE